MSYDYVMYLHHVEGTCMFYLRIAGTCVGAMLIFSVYFRFTMPRKGEITMRWFQYNPTFRKGIPPSYLGKVIILWQSQTAY
jgi:hypothetical protein